MTCIKTVRRGIWLPAVLLLLLTVTGCWDNAEINGRAFVLGFGADKASTANAYDFTFQLAIPVSGDSSTEGAVEFTNYTVTEPSPAAAIRTLEKNLGRQINFEQLNIILIGEELSHENFTPLTELFFRRASVRRQSSVAVCEGRAMEFFSAPSTGRSVATDASVMLQSYDDKSGASSLTMNLHSFFKVLSNTDEFYLLKIAAVADPTGAAADIPSPPTAASQETGLLRIIGAEAYSRTGDYRGELDGQELELLRLMSGHRTCGILTAQDPQSGRTVYYQLKQSRCRVRCGVVNDVTTFDIDLHVQCVAADVGQLYDGGQSGESAAHAEQIIEESLTSRLEALAEKSRTRLGSSVLGLQDTLRQNMPDRYESSADRWEEIYAASQIRFRVNCTVNGGGITK